MCIGSDKKHSEPKWITNFMHKTALFLKNGNFGHILVQSASYTPPHMHIYFFKTNKVGQSITK